MTMPSIRQSFKATCQRLAPLGSEAEATARIIFEDVGGYDRNYIFADGDREIPDFVQARIDKVADSVLAGQPVQYAVGRARFMGMDFKVTPAVLIPRPETEGLVDLVVDDWRGRADLAVLDVCTGSGCIGIALARALPFASVEALDISDEALAIARDNARTLGAGIAFGKADALALTPAIEPLFDIIVSNPPYVCESEKASMDSRVLDHEPHLALFVPDSDPLRFYKAIAAYARTALKPGGALYFEINPLCADAMRRMLEAYGFVDVDIVRDYRGLERFAKSKQSQAS